MRRGKRAGARGPVSYTVSLELPDCVGEGVPEAVDSFVKETRVAGLDWLYAVRENETPRRSFLYFAETKRVVQVAEPLPPITFRAGAMPVALDVLRALAGFRVELCYLEDPPAYSPENPVEILRVEEGDGGVVVAEVRDGATRPNFTWTVPLNVLSTIKVLGREGTEMVAGDV